MLHYRQIATESLADLHRVNIKPVCALARTILGEDAGGSLKRASRARIVLISRRDSGENLCAGALHVLKRFLKGFLAAGIKLDVIG